MNDDTTSTLPHEPDANALAALSEGRCSAPERDRLIEHLSDCQDCREIFAGLARLTQSAQSEGRSSWKWLGLAASLVIAAALGLRVATISPEAPVRVLPPPAAAPTSVPGIATAAPPLEVPKGEPTPPRPASDARRGGQRRVGAKSFRLVSGEWRDESYDATADLPLVEASTPSARAQLLTARPELGPYAALGERVLVVFEGSVYRLGPPAP